MDNIGSGKVSAMDDIENKKDIYLSSRKKYNNSNSPPNLLNAKSS